MTRKLRPYTEPPRRRGPLIPRTPDTAATGWFIVSALWLAAATGLGALLGLQLLIPNVIPGFSIINYGRVQPAFVNALVFGWLTCAAIGAILYITPRVTGTRLFSESLANFALIVWNLFVVAPGLATLLFGWTEGRPLAEFVKPIDLVVVIVFVLLNVNFWATVAARVEPRLYVSLWFFGAGLIAFPVLYVIGNVPGIGGSVDALLNAYYVRSLEGYWLLGVGIGALHYVVARMADSTLYSARLAALGFWSFVALWGLSGAQYLVWAPVPYWLQTLSVVASVLLLIPLMAVLANLLLTLRGRYGRLITNSTMQFSLVALAFMLVSATLEAILPLRSVRSLVGMTDWDLGVFTLAALGTYSFAFFAVIDYAFPRLLRRAAAFRPAADVHLGACFAGAAVAGFALLGAGLLKGSLFVDGVVFGEISGAMTIPYAIAAGGYGLFALGAVALLVHLFLLYTTGRAVGYELATSPATVAAAAH